MKRNGACQLILDLHIKINDQISIGYVDVPGHENFIHNMIAGLAGIDFVLNVIAADDGPKTQTFEHLEILNLLGIEDGAIVSTKIDKVDETQIEELESKLKGILKETSLSRAPIFRISSLKKMAFIIYKNSLKIKP